MSGTEYQKIPGPFIRDHATNELTTEWSSPELEALKDVPWNFTEKVDGTNVRIIWDGYRVTVAGRTDNAQMPVPLSEWLRTTFGGPDKEQLFEQKFGTSTVVMYGEGYGGKIQNGGGYRSDQSFILFDVLIDGWWLLRPSVEDIADYFGIQAVPLVLEGVSLGMAIDHVRLGLPSEWDGVQWAEGLVGVTQAGLRSRRGDRVIVKVKHRDLFAKQERLSVPPKEDK
jgi:hypothetical protein